MNRLKSNCWEIVDDMFNIIKEFHKIVQNFDSLSYDNNLIELYILFRQNYNYKPMIKFQGGRITYLFLLPKNIKIKIQSQDLDKDLMGSKSSVRVVKKFIIIYQLHFLIWKIYFYQIIKAIILS